MTLPLGDVVLGCALLAVTLGASGATAWLIIRRQLSSWTGAVMASALALLTVVATLAAHVLPLTLGVMSRATVIATALLLLACATRIRAVDADRECTAVGSSAAVSSLAAAAALFGLSVFAVAFAFDHRAVAIGDVDSLAFHLPQSGRWLQSGSLWQIDSLVPSWAFGHYPNSGDVFHLTVMLPWDNDALVRFISFPFVVLTVMALYATGVELGARRAAALTFALLAVALPASMVLVLNYGMTDAIAVAGFACAILFGTRHARTGARADLVLGAAGLGLALGTKWYGLSGAVVLLVVWVGARSIGRQGRRQVTGDVLWAAGITAAIGGIWLLRNLVLSGNPVFPAKIAPLGVTIFDAPPDPVREQAFSLSHYATDFDIWRDLIADQLLLAFGFGGGLLLVVAGATVVVTLSSRNREPRVATLGVASLALIAMYVALPYTALGPEGEPILVGAAARYAMPAMIAAAPVAAWLASRYHRAGMALELIGAALVFEAIRRYTNFGLPESFESRDPRNFAVGIAAVTAIGLVARAQRRSSWQRIAPGVRTPAVVALGALGAVAIVATVDRQQQGYNRARYTLDPAYTWLAENAPSGQRVGITGVSPYNDHPPQWPAFGPRIRNEVEYIGPVIRERLERYTRRAPYRAALRSGDYDLVLVGLGPGPDGKVPEIEWTRSAGYREVARSIRVAVLVR